MLKEQTKHLKLLFSMCVLAASLAAFPFDAKAYVPVDGLSGVVSPDPDAPVQSLPSDNNNDSGGGSGDNSGGGGNSGGSNTGTPSNTGNSGGGFNAASFSAGINSNNDYGTCVSERTTLLAQCQEQLKSCPAMKLPQCAKSTQECVSDVQRKYSCTPQGNAAGMYPFGKFDMGRCLSERTHMMGQCQEIVKSCSPTKMAECADRIKQCSQGVQEEYDCAAIERDQTADSSDDDGSDYGANDDAKESASASNADLNKGFASTHDDKPPTPETPNPCKQDGAKLTNSFAHDPCALTRDNNNIDYAREHQAGWRFIDYVGNWWETNFLPDLKGMTAQLHASIIDQTRQIGSIMDAENVQNAAGLVQRAELEAKKAMQTNENSCMAATSQLALGSTLKASNAIAKSFVYGAAARSAGIRLPGDIERIERLAAAERAKNGSSVFNSAEAAPAASRVLSPAADQKERFDTYCKYFRDPDDNAGQWGDACPVSSAAAEIWDGDIDIEDFLLKDTIDLAKPEERAAATAIMQNLLEPKILPRLPDGGTNVDGVLKTPQGQQQVLEKQHLAAIRKLASGVVSSIISRRAAIPGTDQVFNIDITKYASGGGGSSSDPGGEEPAAPTGTPSAGSKGSYQDFLNGLGQRESDGTYTAVNSLGYVGKYQFGKGALTDLGYCKNDGKASNSSCQWTGKDGINSRQDFLNNKAVQEKAIVAYQKILAKRAASYKWEKYYGQTIHGIVITPSGLLAASHLLGQGTVNQFLKGGNNAPVKADANGTKLTEYLALFAGYDTPTGGPAWGGASEEQIAAASGTMAAAAKGKKVNTKGEATGVGGDDGGGSGSGSQLVGENVAISVKSTIQEIRKDAGINEHDIAPYPSYNEIMLAMTKERFFKPNYFVQMANDEGAIRQEQTMVDSYIAIQMQDIYRVQEQVNMLLAARASMKLNSKEFPTRIENMPVTK